MTRSLELDADGDLKKVRGTVAMVDSTAQRVTTRLRMLLGEWFLDLSDGTPYLQTIFAKQSTLELARSAIAARVRGTEGVRAVRAVVLDADRATRRLRATVYAVGPNGDFEVRA